MIAQQFVQSSTCRCQSCRSIRICVCRFCFLLNSWLDFEARLEYFRDMFYCASSNESRRKLLRQSTTWLNRIFDSDSIWDICVSISIFVKQKDIEINKYVWSIYSDWEKIRSYFSSLTTIFFIFLLLKDHVKARRFNRLMILCVFLDFSCVFSFCSHSKYFVSEIVNLFVTESRDLFDSFKNHFSFCSTFLMFSIFLCKRWMSFLAFLTTIE